METEGGQITNPSPFTSGQIPFSVSILLPLPFISEADSFLAAVWTMLWILL